MRHSDYSDRDYGFGQQVLALRTASNLTQSGLAELLGISRQAVVGWEAGASYPSPQHLKHFIELCCQRNVFHSGQEAEEIRALWQNSRVRVPLDETWLVRLLEEQHESPTAPASGLRPSSAASETPTPGPLTDWGDAPEVATFYGRTAELALPSDWMLDQRCRVVSILGTGKSALAVLLITSREKPLESLRRWRAAGLRFARWACDSSMPAQANCCCKKWM